jgi:hypothetical protein
MIVQVIVILLWYPETRGTTLGLLDVETRDRIAIVRSR